MPHFHNPCLGGAGGQGGAYEIEQSLRFDGSSKLERSNSNDGSSRSFTLSYWIKKTYLGPNNMSVFGANDGVSNWAYISYGESSGDDDQLIARSNGSQSGYSNGYVFNALRKHRDPSAWQHHFLVVDKTAGTSKGYINGVLDDGGTYGGTRSSNGWTFNGTASAVRIGVSAETGNNNYFSGYLAEFYFVDGTAMDETDFGEFDDNGVWRPIEPSISSFGTNGYYLKFDPSATNGIGHDHSGNGNNWTPSGFTTSGTGTDVMSDTPTTNWATLNPLWNPIQATYAEGNLKFTGGSEHSPSASSISASSGKFYFEATALSGSQAKWSLGIIDIDIPYRKQTSAINYIPGYTPNNIYSEGDAISLYDNNIYKNGSIVVSSPFSGGAVTAGDVVQMAVDIDAGKIWFGIDGTWNNGGGTEGAFNPSGHDTTFTANKSYIFHFTAESCGWEVNFGQRAFAYTPPTGFNALNTSNLPAPDIADGSDYFNTVLYTGNNVNNRSIPNVGFQPDFVWVKNRSDTDGWSHILTDAVRGGGPSLQSANTQTEYSANPSGYVSAFNSDGFVVTEGDTRFANTNASPASYVSWNWLAANGTETNTDGDIQSTVSANRSAGFSIVGYTGKTYTGNTSTDTGTVGHGLGVSPSFIMIKCRETNTDWICYHSALGNNSYIELNLSAGERPNTPTVWASTSPTDTVFTVGSLFPTYINDNKTTIAYCFAEVEGYSKFGSYTGNGQNDPNCPFIYTGFKPAFLLTNCATGGSNWLMLDVARGQYYNPIGYKNSTKESLYASTNAAESNTGTGFQVDFLSNGFKIRATVANELNAPGETHIYAAFAENPFGGDGVTPATAR